MKPLTATTHLFVLADTHRADARGVQNDSDPFGRQSNLKLAEENKIPKAVLCIVAIMLSYWIIGFAGSTTRLNSDSVTKPSFSAAAFFGRDRGQFATCNRLFQISSETGTIEINGSIVRG
jgi:hypothetical protein